MGHPLSMFATVVLAVALTCAATLLVRRVVDHQYLREHGPLGALYATFGVMYSVLIASTVVSVWERYETAEMTVLAETNAIFDLNRIAEGFPADIRDLLQQRTLAYADAVADTEWPAMANHTAPSPEANAAMVALYRAYVELPDADARADPLFTASLDQLDKLDDARGERLSLSKRGLPPPLWTALYVGGVLTVVFSLLLATEKTASHLLATGAMAAMIVMLLVLVSDLDAPFQPPLGIPATEFSRGIGLLQPGVAAPAAGSPAASATP